MPNYSQRGELAPESPIRKLALYAVAAKSRGINVYHLNIGQPDIKSPKKAIDAIKNLDLDILSYTESEGILPYRNKLSKYYKSLCLEIEPENFLVCNGASEAIEMTISCICDKDDEIIVPEPFYANYISFTSAIDVITVPVTSTLENSFALPSIESFEEKITSKTRAILICNPSNPTGYLYTKEELEKLRDIVIKHDLYIIVDEVYREFVYDGLKHHSILEFSGLDEHAIVIDSESKRYSMCGIRIGCIVSRNKKFLSIALKFAQARLSASILGQIAATAAYDEPKEYIENVRTEYVERRNLLIKLLEDIPNVKCSKPKGAFYCVVELPVDDAEKFSIWLLNEFNYNNETVMLAPAAGFYANRELGKKQVRIAYVIDKKDIEKAIFILRKALEAYDNI